VREIFGTAWQAGQDPERIEVTVGKSGVRHLDLAQVWTPKEGWQFSDEADHRALDEVHWKSIDKGWVSPCCPLPHLHIHDLWVDIYAWHDFVFYGMLHCAMPVATSIYGNLMHHPYRNA
jgi:hypothetical protein